MLYLSAQIEDFPWFGQYILTKQPVMSRYFQLLIGPELLWAVAYCAALWLAQANHPPTKLLDKIILQTSNIAPLLVLLSFLLWYVPGVIRPWLLPRIWVAGVLGSHFFLEKAMEHYSKQGPGIGTAYMVGMLFSLFILIAGSVYVLIRVTFYQN